jgi:hypothetical protein
VVVTKPQSAEVASTADRNIFDPYMENNNTGKCTDSKARPYKFQSIASNTYDYQHIGMRTIACAILVPRRVRQVRLVRGSASRAADVPVA